MDPDLDPDRAKSSRCSRIGRRRQRDRLRLFREMEGAAAGGWLARLAGEGGWMIGQVGEAFAACLGVGRSVLSCSWSHGSQCCAVEVTEGQRNVCIVVAVNIPGNGAARHELDVATQAKVSRSDDGCVGGR